MEDRAGSLRLYLPSGPDDIILERPLQLHCGDLKLITLRTPGFEQEWALGFLLGEALIGRYEDVESVKFEPASDGGLDVDTVSVKLQSALHTADNSRLTRVHEIRASCGICGTESAATLLQHIPAISPGQPVIATDALQLAYEDLQARQSLFQSTGGAHAAVIFDAATGSVLAHAEDVGRHNAVDKAIGAALQSGADFSTCGILLSGRSGYDLVIKALRAGIPIIASVGASTSFAYDLCKTAKATLIAFYKPDSQRVLCDTGRIANQ